MASLTVMTLCTSITPKLATFKSPTPTLLPLPPPRSFSYSSSLPTPCLKASYGGIRVLQTSRDFKCYAFPECVSTIVVPDEWQDIPDVDDNKEVQQLGEFAVRKHNEQAIIPIQFKHVVAAQSVAKVGNYYRLNIQGQVDKVDKVYKALVYTGDPFCFVYFTGSYP